MTRRPHPAATHCHNDMPSLSSTVAALDARHHHHDHHHPHRLNEAKSETASIASVSPAPTATTSACQSAASTETLQNPELHPAPSAMSLPLSSLPPGSFMSGPLTIGADGKLTYPTPDINQLRSIMTPHQAAMANSFTEYNHQQRPIDRDEHDSKQQNHHHHNHQHQPDSSESTFTYPPADAALTARRAQFKNIGLHRWLRLRHVWCNTASAEQTHRSNQVAASNRFDATGSLRRSPRRGTIVSPTPAQATANIVTESRSAQTLREQALLRHLNLQSIERRALDPHIHSVSPHLSRQTTPRPEPLLASHATQAQKSPTVRPSRLKQARTSRMTNAVPHRSDDNDDPVDADADQTTIDHDATEQLRQHHLSRSAFSPYQSLSLLPTGAPSSATSHDASVMSSSPSRSSKSRSSTKSRRRSTDTLDTVADAHLTAEQLSQLRLQQLQAQKEHALDLASDDRALDVVLSAPVYVSTLAPPGSAPPLDVDSRSGMTRSASASSDEATIYEQERLHVSSVMEALREQTVFPQRVTLRQMVDILQVLWEDES